MIFISYYGFMSLDFKYNKIKSNLTEVHYVSDKINNNFILVYIVFDLRLIETVN